MFVSALNAMPRNLRPSVEVVGNIRSTRLFKPTPSPLVIGMTIRLAEADGEVVKTATVVDIVPFVVHPDTKAMTLAGRRVEIDDLMELACACMMRLDDMIDAIHQVGGYVGGAQVIYLKHERGPHGQ